MSSKPKAGIPEQPDEVTVKPALSALPPNGIQWLPCPHASVYNDPNKLPLGNCQTIDLGEQILALCPICWQVVKAAVYEELLAGYAKVHARELAKFAR